MGVIFQREKFTWGKFARGGGGGAFFLGAYLLGGHFLSGNFPGANYTGGIFQGSIFPGDIFSRTHIGLYTLTMFHLNVRTSKRKLAN